MNAAPSGSQGPAAQPAAGFQGVENTPPPLATGAQQLLRPQREGLVTRNKRPSADAGTEPPRHALAVTMLRQPAGRAASDTAAARLQGIASAFGNSASGAEHPAVRAAAETLPPAAAAAKVVHDPRSSASEHLPQLPPEPAPSVQAWNPMQQPTQAVEEAAHGAAAAASSSSLPASGSNLSHLRSRRPEIVPPLSPLDAPRPAAPPAPLSQRSNGSQQKLGGRSTGHQVCNLLIVICVF